MKKLRSIISLLLVSVMIFAVAAAGIGSASAAETFVEGIYHYTVTNGKATITDVVGVDTEIIEITIPSTLGGYPVTAIGERAVREEGKLRRVIIPSNVETMGESAFVACVALETVTFEDNSPLKELPVTCFQNCRSLKTVNFGKNSVLETVGRAAFVNCTSLESITLPETLKTIGDSAFESCTSLKNVTIPKNVVSVGKSAFCKCESLENFAVDSANTAFTSDNWGVLYNKAKTAIIAYPAGNKRPVYTIPAYITNVAESAFMGAIYLEDVSWLNPQTKFGISTFSYCTNLYRVTIPEGTTSLADWMFNACYSLTDVKLPDSLTWLGAGVFHWCTALEYVEIPDSITFIPSNAYKECYRLKTVVLPETLTEIGANAFSRCFALENINIPEKVGVIGNTAFYQCYSLKEFVFPERVMNVETDVLRYCHGLESVTFSDDTLQIYSGALEDCRSLESVNVPRRVFRLPGTVFASCVSLEQINIDPDNKNIVTDENGVVYSGDGETLYYYPAAKAGSVFTVPDTVTTVGAGAFISAQNLASVVIPASVTAVADRAFEGYNIRDIYFAGTQEQWAAFAVADDEALKNVTVHFNHQSTDHVHSYNQMLTQEPTCDRMGKKLYTCDCSATVTADWHYAASRMLCKGGNYIYFDGNDSDCTDKGKSMFGCSECVKIFDTIDKAKIAHDFEISVSDSAVAYTCGDCGNAYSEPIPDGAKYVKFVYPEIDHVYILNPGEKLGYPVTPVKEDLTFAYWVDETAAKVDVSVMPEENVVLYPFYVKHVENDVYGVSAKFDQDCFAEGYDVDFVVDTVDDDREKGAVLFKDESYAPVRLFDIAFESDGKEIQPQDGKTVEVRIPVPEGYEYCEEFLIYHRHGGSLYDKYLVKPVDGMIVFTADKFSEFEVYARVTASIASLPVKIFYAYKEIFDVTGLSLLITDEGGNSFVIDDTSKMQVSGYDPNKVGTQTLTVGYEGTTTTFDVTVQYTWWQMLIRILLLGFLWY